MSFKCLKIAFREAKALPHPLHLDEEVSLVVDVVASVIVVLDGVNILSGETKKIALLVIRKFLDEVNSLFPILLASDVVCSTVGPSTVRFSITRD